MNIKHLDHIALVCSDVSVSRKWYQEVLGMEWIYRDKWDGNPVFLKKNKAMLALFQRRHPGLGEPGRGSGIDHFAFRAETMEDYLDAKRVLSQKCVSFDEQDHDVSFSVYISDPDGITVEITTYDL